MAVTYARVGNTATITVTVDVTDLVALTKVAADDKIATAIQRADAQLQALTTAQVGATILAKQITDLQAVQAGLPPKVPTF